MTDRNQPQRHLDLQGSYNIRDIGGYRTRDGRSTRWRTLLRADTLHRLTPASQDALVRYGVRTVVDLRGSEELAAGPNVFASSNTVNYRHHDIIGEQMRDERPEPPPVFRGPSTIATAYANILDRRHDAVCGAVAALTDPRALPAVVHCHGGKDRTGIITALVLALAGVSDEAVAEDYALSGRFLFQRHLEMPDPRDASEGIETWQDYQRNNCPPEAMLQTLAHLVDRYGDAESYLLSGGMTRAQIDALRQAVVE